MKKIILVSLIACACVFAKNKNDSFCEDIGITLVKELNDCAIHQNDSVGITYNCANGQFFIDREAELYVVTVLRDTIKFIMYFLPKHTNTVCAMRQLDELGIPVIQGKTKMRYDHRFDVYDEFKKRFVKKN